MRLIVVPGFSMEKVTLFVVDSFTVSTVPNTLFLALPT